MSEIKVVDRTTVLVEAQAVKQAEIGSGSGDKSSIANVSNQSMTEDKQHNENYSGRNFRSSIQLTTSLKPGMKGFLCSSNYRFFSCVRDALKILSEYSKEENRERTPEENADQADCEKASQVDDKRGSKVQTEKVKGATRQAATDTKCSPKFEPVITEVKSVVFIGTTIDKPTELIYKIFADVSAKQTTSVRNIAYFTPVEVTCKVKSISDAKSHIMNFVGNRLKGKVSYKLSLRIYGNQNIWKDDLLQLIIHELSRAKPSSVLNLQNPDITIIVDILKSTMCLAAVTDYVKNKTYNLMKASHGRGPERRERKPAPDAGTGVGKQQERVKTKTLTSRDAGMKGSPSVPMKAVDKPEGKDKVKASSSSSQGPESQTEGFRWGPQRRYYRRF